MNLSVLILQIVIISIAARLMGLLFRRLRQPQVIGEMVAGILLGPSFLGMLMPDFSAALFPIESLSYLNTLSQVGLILFMFLVGLELNPSLLRNGGDAVLLSHVSIVFPMFLGTLLAVLLYPKFSDDSVSFSHFALFMGIAMSITAFPVLARILKEHNMLRSRVGVLSITCASVHDITAWCILAGVVLLVNAGDMLNALLMTVVGSAAYVCFMVLIVRRPLRKLAQYYERHGKITREMLSVILLLVLASAWITESLGIHVVFGAFLVGAILPRDKGFVKALAGKIEDLTVVLLLPLFFALTGLRTSIGLISGVEMWFYLIVITLVAILGKMGGAAVAARALGLSWKEAGAIGVLMNTRGLMEIIVLNIGLDIGVISNTLFTLLVFMALITTFMATPLLNLIYPVHLCEQERAKPNTELAA